MEVVTGALPSAISKLGDLLVGEYNLQKGVKGEIVFLQHELESMKGALIKVSNTPPDQLDIQDKIWARDLRELSYDIEDSIDTFMVRGKGNQLTKLHGIKKFIDRSVSLFRKGKILHGIATEIRDIKSHVIEVHERRRRYEVNLGSDHKSVAATVDPRLFAQYEKVTELVGIDKARDELIKILTEGDEMSMQPVQIVSIIGFGGLGKTTIANALYEKIRAIFDCCAFVSVSQTPDIKKLFKGILYQLDKRQYDHINEKILDEGQLISELDEYLQKKRCFIVIDDIWDISVWKMIKCALPNNNVGSKILITTRILNVAEQAGGTYNLRPLSPNSSRRLLYRRVFGNTMKHINEDVEKCPDDELAEVCDRIIKKCAGVPLAIIVMASLLTCKARNKMEWYKVYNSIGTGLENNLDVKNMRKILSLSYYELPFHLRACLLYLSMFPEDFEIDKDRLIRMWIAEGFIQHEKQGKSLFELGECYINELRNRSMIQPIYDYANMIYGWRVHDMVLDLICSISNEENFLTILSGMEHKSPSNTIRRLSLQNRNEDHAITLVDKSMHHVRSVIVFPSAVDLLPVLWSFRVLRVLDLQGCDISKSCLKFVGNLYHLRLLGLRDTFIVEVPEEIGNIQFLQTLDVRGTNVPCLPWTVSQLRHLMFLYTDGSTRVPNGLGSLTSLEELSLFRINDSTVDIVQELGKLRELRVLHISFNEWNDKMVECLSKLQKIQDLYISIGKPSIGALDAWVIPPHLRRLDAQSGCWFLTLPAWTKPSLLRDLSYLSIAVRELQHADLEILGRLPALNYLDLLSAHKDLGILGGFVVSAGLFPSLVYCKLCGFVGPVVFQQGAMPKLRNLHSRFSVREAREIASSNGGLDLGLGNLPLLHEVSIRLDADGASEEELNDLEAALRHATKIHPKHPRLQINGIAVEDADRRMAHMQLRSMRISQYFFSKDLESFSA